MRIDSPPAIQNSTDVIERGEPTMVASMRPALISLVSTIQLSRLANAFAGVANLWFVVLWCRAHTEQESLTTRISDSPLWTLLGLTAVIGVGMSTYAGALNDLFDLRHDQAFLPDRPLPAGRLSPQFAAIIGFVSLIFSVLAATALGTSALLVCLLCAAIVIFYIVAGRHVPSFGVVAVGAIYGSHMLIPNYGMRFVWPIMLVIAHTMAVHAVVHRLDEKRPRFSILTIFGALIGAGLLGLALIAQTREDGPLWAHVYSWYGLGWPLAAVVIFIGTAVNKVRFASSQAFAAEKLQRYGALWIGFYGTAWFLGAGLYVESLILLGLVALGVIWMLVIRDLGAWIEQPIGYRW